MRKPAFCICEKDIDQLHCNREADQRLCFRYDDSTIPLLSKSEILAIFCDYPVRFVFDLVGNPEDRFSQKEAHLLFQYGKDRFSHDVAQLYNFCLFFQIGCQVIWLDHIFF